MRTGSLRRGRKRGVVGGVLAVAVLTSAFGPAPAAQAQLYKIEVNDCKAKTFIKAVEMANAAADTDIVTLKYKCKYEFGRPYFDEGLGLFTANALPVVTDDLTIYGNKATADGDVDDGTAGFRFLQILETGADIAVELRDITVSGFELSVPPADVSGLPFAGAILNVGADLSLRKTAVRDNEINVLSTTAQPVPLAFGGGIFSLGGSLTLRGATVANNEVNLLQLGDGVATAAVGGAGSAGGAGIDIADSTVKSNKVSGVGIGAEVRALAGGLAVDEGGELTMADTTVSGNSVSAKTSFAGPNSGAAAGGIVLGPSDEIHEIADSDVTDNRAGAKGGSFTALAGGIANGNAGGAGVAGLLVDEDDAPPFADLTDVEDDDRTYVKYNTVACDGVCQAQGGGYVNALEGLQGLPGTAEFNRTMFKGNVADGDEGLGAGGAIAVSGGAGDPVVVLDGATVTQNKAKGDAFARGGGIFAEAPSDVEVDESDVFKNKPDDCWAISVGEFCDFS